MTNTPETTTPDLMSVPDEDITRPSRVVQNVIATLWPALVSTLGNMSTVDGVTLSTVGTHGGYQQHFLGILLRVTDVNHHAVTRRVMLRQGTLDLSAIRARHAELAEIAKAEAGKAAERRERASVAYATERAAQALASRLGIHDPDGLHADRQHPGMMVLTIAGLTAEQAEAVWAWARTSLPTGATQSAS